jgi:hypothetical protein
MSLCPSQGDRVSELMHRPCDGRRQAPVRPMKEDDGSGVRGGKTSQPGHAR